MASFVNQGCDSLWQEEKKKINIYLRLNINKYRNKYRNQSTRLQKWNYGWNGAYFITICTHNRECYFGDVVEGEMKLSSIGTLADVFWHEIRNHTNGLKNIFWKIRKNGEMINLITGCLGNIIDVATARLHRVVCMSKNFNVSSRHKPVLVSLSIIYQPGNLS